jgi:hypothetical protein
MSTALLGTALRRLQAERWFQGQHKKLMGKRFMEKVSCDKFFSFMEEQHPTFAAENENKLNIMSICKKQRQVLAFACSGGCAYVVGV